MWPVKPAVCADKKCQAAKCYKKVDKNCQKISIFHTQPVQPAKKKSCEIWSMPRPAKLQSKYKKKNQVKFNQVSMSDDKKSQSIKS